MKIVKDVLSVFFIVITGALTLLYLSMIYDKIVRPEYRNMNPDGFYLSGLLVLLFLFFDILLIRRLLRKIKAK